MRRWAAASYGQDGRAASSLEDNGYSHYGYTNARDVTAQIETTHAAGQGGAPGADAQTKSGSGDPGRARENR